MEIAGEDVSQLPLTLPVQGGGQLFFLIDQLAAGPVAGPLDRLNQILPPLAHPLRLLPFLIKAVQQGGKALPLLKFRFGAVLKDGTEGEVHRLSVPHQHAGSKILPADGVQELFQLLGQLFSAVSRPEGQLTGHQRGEAGKGVQQ